MAAGDNQKLKIIALGDGIRVTGPKSLVDDMRTEAKRLAELYP